MTDASIIEVDISLHVSDRKRRFDLAAKFSSDAPFAALYGPSGSGKTLTLQAIAGLIAPDAGHIRIGGRTLFDSSEKINLPAAKRRVGYLFQDYALFPHLTVRQNVAFGLTSWNRRRLSSEDSSRVDALLDNLDLSSMANSRPSTLSGGQQQRVALARALACKPQILLLDEPFASLNPMLRESLRADLARIRSEWKIPALMITHDIEDVLALADVAFVYEAGNVVKSVNLRDASTEEFARREMGGSPVAEETPLRKRLRSLLVK